MKFLFPPDQPENPSEENPYELEVYHRFNRHLTHDPKALDLIVRLAWKANIKSRKSEARYLTSHYPLLKHDDNFHLLAPSPTPNECHKTNCISCTVGDHYREIWPQEPHVWPAHLPKAKATDKLHAAATLENFTRMYKARGFQPSSQQPYNHKFQRVVLYMQEGIVIHGALELGEGIWVSKWNSDKMLFSHSLGSIVREIKHTKKINTMMPGNIELAWFQRDEKHTSFTALGYIHKEQTRAINSLRGAGYLELVIP